MEIRAEKFREKGLQWCKSNTGANRYLITFNLSGRSVEKVPGD